MVFLLLALALPGFPELKKQFDYDAAEPLNVERKLLFERGGVKIFDVTYSSPRGGRVTAYLTVPSKAGNYPGILFGHWGPGNRTEFFPEAQIYSRAGAVCLMIDWPWTRPEPWYANADDIEEPRRALQLHAQAVIDLRRGLDLLAAEPGVDPARLAYAGHSYGAQFGAILAAVDKRLRAAVLMAGVPELDSIVLEGKGPGVAKWRERTGMEKIKASLEVVRASAAIQ
jgi:dienelactone hydrolase